MDLVADEHRITVPSPSKPVQCATAELHPSKAKLPMKTPPRTDMKTKEAREGTQESYM
jgi:hypothetical protein